MTSGVNIYEPKGWILRLGSKVRDIYSAAIVTFMCYLSRDVFVKIKTTECLKTCQRQDNWSLDFKDNNTKCHTWG